jgi:hypothetical protein
MAKYFETICLGCIIFLGIAAIVSAEKASELYIPVGQSPGLSDEYNLIGRIDAVDYQNRSLTVTDSTGRFTVHTTEYTLILLDKSMQRQPNRYGTFSEIKPSIIVEVRFEAGKRHRPAEWIKLQIDK